MKIFLENNELSIHLVLWLSAHYPVSPDVPMKNDPQLTQHIFKRFRPKPSSEICSTLKYIIIKGLVTIPVYVHILIHSSLYVLPSPTPLSSSHHPFPTSSLAPPPPPTHTHAHTHMHTHRISNEQQHTRTRTYTYTHTCTHTHFHVHTNTHTHV